MFLKSILILTLSYYARCFDLFIEKRELSNIFIGSNSKIKEEGPAVFLVKENKVNEVLTSSVMKNILVPLSPAVKRVRLKVRRPQHDLSLTSHITSLNQFVLKHPSIIRSVIEETKTATFEELTINFVCNTITNKLIIVDIVFNFTLQSDKYFKLITRTTGWFTYRKQCGNTVQTNLLANNVNATVKMSTGKIDVNLQINVLTVALMTVLAIAMCLVVFYFVRRSLCQTKLQNPSKSFSFKSEASLLPRVQKSPMKTKPKPRREIPKLKVPFTATNLNGLENSVEIRELKTRRDTSLIVVAKPPPNSLPAIVEETV